MKNSVMSSRSRGTTGGVCAAAAPDPKSCPSQEACASGRARKAIRGRKRLPLVRSPCRHGPRRAGPIRKGLVWPSGLGAAVRVMYGYLSGVSARECRRYLRMCDLRLLRRTSDWPCSWAIGKWGWQLALECVRRFSRSSYTQCLACACRDPHSPINKA